MVDEVEFSMRRTRDIASRLSALGMVVSCICFVNDSWNAVLFAAELSSLPMTLAISAAVVWAVFLTSARLFAVADWIFLLKHCWLILNDH